MTLDEFNAIPAKDAETLLMDCCGCARWAAAVAARRPFADVGSLYSTADALWQNLERADWLEAFGHHPQIGEKAAGGSASAQQWAAGEQSGVRSAGEDLKARLARGNSAYYEKFGYIYIVCATGKSADEMLAILDRRLENDPASELPVAAEQQRLITRIRLDKLLAGGPAR
jgi:2-oxo-4-hydroxy-4-carboxy-5-ureidoimidazoline decarboxylase